MPISIQRPPLCTPLGDAVHTEYRVNTSTELSAGVTQIRRTVFRVPLAKQMASSLPHTTSLQSWCADPQGGSAHGV